MSTNIDAEFLIKPCDLLNLSFKQTFSAMFTGILLCHYKNPFGVK